MDCNTMKIQRVALISFFALSVLLGPSAASAAEQSASALVKGFYDQLVSTMKQGEALGFDGRFKKLEPVVKSSYNMPLMTRFAVGPGWATAQPAQQQKMIEAFATFSAATYASRFTKYDGEKFEVIGEKPASGGGVIVETKLTPKDEAPVSLNYVVRNDETGNPKIVDVLLDSTISELATRRSEFSSIVKREGIDALIRMLNEKSKKMGST